MRGRGRGRGRGGFRGRGGGRERFSPKPFGDAPVAAPADWSTWTDLQEDDVPTTTQEPVPVPVPVPVPAHERRPRRGFRRESDSRPAIVAREVRDDDSVSRSSVGIGTKPKKYCFL